MASPLHTSASLSIDDSKQNLFQSFITSAPQPMEGLQANAPPPFLTKTYDMVDDPATDPIVSWSTGCNSFIVSNLPEFSLQVLPRYFKHNNFSSFVRQLNTYGFRKVDPDRWEFANEGFLRGQRQMLQNIHRRKPALHLNPYQHVQGASMAACVEVGKFGLEGEIESLKRDKNVLMVELVRLRQQQQATDQELQAMGHRFLDTEQRQQQMMNFLAKAMQRPSFLGQLMQQGESKQLEEGRKKRRLRKQGDGLETLSEGQIVKYQPGSVDSVRLSLMQFFNLDSCSKVEPPSSPFEALLNEMGSPPSQQTQGVNFQGRETFAEMPGEMPGLIASDISSRTPACSPSLLLQKSGAAAAGSTLSSNELPASEYLVSFPDTLTPKGNNASLPSTEMDITTDIADYPAQAEAPSTGIAAVGGPTLNDAFWNQLLSVDIEAHCTEADVGPAIPEGCAQKQVNVSEGEWWSRNSNMDRLVERMGQLEPGSRP